MLERQSRAAWKKTLSPLQRLEIEFRAAEADQLWLRPKKIETVGSVTITFREGASLERDAVLQLYRSCEWSAAERPDELFSALKNSHSVISAWKSERLVGLVNAISDGALVFYYPHLLVEPGARGQGIGGELMRLMREKYSGFHQQVLLSYDAAAPVYEKAGFVRAPGVVPYWIYSGD